MQIRVGYELVYECPQPTPMILTLNVHYTRASDLVAPDHLVTDPAVPVTAYRDGFGNWCTPDRRAARPVAPSPPTRVVNDSGAPDPVVHGGRAARRWRTCPRRRWSSCSAAATARPTGCRDIAWKLFGKTPPGWARVQAICDFVHHHIAFGYEHARPTKTALGGLQRAARASAATTRTWPSRSAAA